MYGFHRQSPPLGQTMGLCHSIMTPKRLITIPITVYGKISGGSLHGEYMAYPEINIILVIHMYAFSSKLALEEAGSSKWVGRFYN